MEGPIPLLTLPCFEWYHCELETLSTLGVHTSTTFMSSDQCCLVLFRNCIGQQFALKEEKVVLAKILRRFELSADTTNPPEMMATLITRAKNGIFLKLKKRNV